MSLISESNLIIIFLLALLILLIYYCRKNSENGEGFDYGDVADSDTIGDVDVDADIYDKTYYDDLDPTRSKATSNRRSGSKYRAMYDIKPDVDLDLDMNDVVFDTNELISMINKKKNCRPDDSDIGYKGRRVNSDFTDMQYHKDYNDVMTAINNITPQKELFNQGFLPVVESEPAKSNAKGLVKLFLKKINFEIKNNVQEYLNVNSGWNDMGKRRREKSGFEIQMEELGLPGSLYNEPASNAPVKLIKINKAEQYTTEDQIRFTIYIILQKINVKDQMVLQVNFYMEREDLSDIRDDRDRFFEKKLATIEDLAKIDPEQIVIIEQVFILGYLSDETLPKTKMDKFHDYSNVQRIDGTIDQEKVVKQMLIKHQERENELNSFMNTVDDDTKEIHDIPCLDSVYSQYKNTRTIMDDLADFPQRAFGGVPI